MFAGLHRWITCLFSDDWSAQDCNIEAPPTDEWRHRGNTPRHQIDPNSVAVRLKLLEKPRPSVGVRRGNRIYTDPRHGGELTWSPTDSCFRYPALDIKTSFIFLLLGCFCIFHSVDSDSWLVAQLRNREPKKKKTPVDRVSELLDSVWLQLEKINNLCLQKFLLHRQKPPARTNWLHWALLGFTGPTGFLFPSFRTSLFCQRRPR